MSEHSFNTELAKEYGIECAIIIKNLDFWLSKNKANKRNIHDEKTWTYMSMSGFSEYFEYLSDNQVRYALKKLEDNNIIETGNYNKIAYDRTKWYTFTNAFCNSHNSILQFSQMELVEVTNGSVKIPEPIPDTNTYTETDTNTDTNITASKEFEEWYKIYPKHQDRVTARRRYIDAYKKKLLPKLDTHINIIKQWIASGKWDDKTYIPMPSTWLNKERWCDDVPVKQTLKKQMTKIEREKEEYINAIKLRVAEAEARGEC